MSSVARLLGFWRRQALLRRLLRLEGQLSTIGTTTFAILASAGAALAALLLIWPSSLQNLAFVLLCLTSLSAALLGLRAHRADRRAHRLQRLAKQRSLTLLETSAELAQISQSERAAQEAGLRAQRSYRAIFENALDGIFQTSPDGRYLAANPALAKLYGYERPADLIGGLTNIAGQLYVDPGRRDAFRTQLQAEDQVTNFVSQVRRRDGTIIWISENARAVRDEAGRVLYYEGTVVDITARRQAEDALQQALLEIEAASRAKMAFLAAMSHELRTPLNSVIGFADVLRKELFGPLGAERYLSYASEIHKSGERLLARIDDILDLARIEGGVVELHEEVHALPEIVAVASNAVRQQGGAPITCDIPDSLPPLRADGRRLRQILVNLIGNAVKFTGPEGAIAINARGAEGGAIALTVADTGIGMAPEQILAALEPFKQLDSALARRFEGIGLGLPIARALVALHEGTLEIDSTPGIGTIVTITFPPNRVEAA